MTKKHPQECDILRGGRTIAFPPNLSAPMADTGVCQGALLGDQEVGQTHLLSLTVDSSVKAPNKRTEWIFGLS
jgi:hypothetical protein